MPRAAVRDHRYEDDASPARCPGCAPANSARYCSSVCGAMPVRQGLKRGSMSVEKNHGSLTWDM